MYTRLRCGFCPKPSDLDAAANRQPAEFCNHAVCYGSCLPVVVDRRMYAPAFRPACPHTWHRLGRFFGTIRLVTEFGHILA